MLDVHCVVNSKSALQDLGQLLRGRAWDHFGTTRYAPGRTTRTSPHPPHRPRMLADQAEHPRPFLGVKGSPVQIRPSRLVVELFEYSYASQEPTKEPFFCAMALPEACADGVPWRPYGATATLATMLPLMAAGRDRGVRGGFSHVAWHGEVLFLASAPACWVRSLPSRP